MPSTPAHRLDEAQRFLCPVHQVHLLWPTLISSLGIPDDKKQVQLVTGGSSLPIPFLKAGQEPNRRGVGWDERTGPGSQAYYPLMGRMRRAEVSATD